MIIREVIARNNVIQHSSQCKNSRRLVAKILYLFWNSLLHRKEHICREIEVRCEQLEDHDK
jgi:hypothetical protein